MQEAVQILGLKFSSEDEKSGKVTWEQKVNSALQCRRAGVQETVQILGFKFSSEDEKSGKGNWEQKVRNAVLCKSEGGSENFR